MESGDDHTIESISRLNHYQVLGLSEASSSEDVDRAMHADRWPWHLLDEDARTFATARRLEAYGVVSVPRSRAEYDHAQGYSRSYLAAAIGEDNSAWGRAWVVGWLVVAALFLIGGPALGARLIGSWFAPGYEEVAVFHAARGCFPDCAPYYSREYVSDSGAFEWFLNSLLMWIALPVAAIATGLLLRTAVSRICGHIIVWVRWSGRRDSWAMTACLIGVIAVPIAAVAFCFITMPDGVTIPQ